MKPPTVADLIVSRHATVRDAFTVIDRNLQGIAFVVTDEGRLCGVISEGDVRRALLAGVDLDAPVDKAMNPAPVSLPVNALPDMIIRAFDGGVQVIPLLDPQGRPVDYASMQRNHRIPVMEPWLGGNELKYVVECIKTNWISSQGRFVQMFEEMFAAVCGAGKAIAVSNGTTALHLALVSLGVGPGDEVIVPDLTFAASANAVIHAGAVPVLVDVSRETWTVDLARAEAAITPRTKAVMAVHLYGHPCEMDSLLDLRERYGLYILEDCAEALGSTFRGRPVGTIGDVGCFSFFGNKMVTTGEGGMVVFKKPDLDARARILRDHGMSKERRYWHVEVGYNYRLTNLQAAVGVAQLERLGEFVQRRRELADHYYANLTGEDGIVLPPTQPWATNIHWLYTILLDERQLGISRDEMMRQLALNGIETRPLFYPLHEMPPYEACARDRSYAVSEELSRTGLSLPSSATVSREDVEFVCGAIKRIVARTRRPTA